MNDKTYAELADEQTRRSIDEFLGDEAEAREAFNHTGHQERYFKDFYEGWQAAQKLHPVPKSDSVTNPLTKGPDPMSRWEWLCRIGLHRYRWEKKYCDWVCTRCLKEIDQ